MKVAQRENNRSYLMEDNPCPNHLKTNIMTSLCHLFIHKSENFTLFHFIKLFCHTIKPVTLILHCHNKFQHRFRITGLQANLDWRDLDPENQNRSTARSRNLDPIDCRVYIEDKYIGQMSRAILRLKACFYILHLRVCEISLCQSGKWMENIACRPQAVEINKKESSCLRYTAIFR